MAQAVIAAAHQTNGRKTRHRTKSCFFLLISASQILFSCVAFLLKKVSEYDLAQKRLQITAGEQRQIRKALNRLRSKYLAAGRYSDGIDKIIIQVAKPNTTRHMFW